MTENEQKELDKKGIQKIINIIKDTAKAYSLTTTPNLERIAKAKYNLFCKKTGNIEANWRKCPCASDDEESFCLSKKCLETINKKGSCHCNLYSKDPLVRVYNYVHGFFKKEFADQIRLHENYCILGDYVISKEKDLFSISFSKREFSYDINILLFKGITYSELAFIIDLIYRKFLDESTGINKDSAETESK